MSTTSNKGLNIALWITQVLLAALYLMAGSTKLFQNDTNIFYFIISFKSFLIEY
jgi:hypothetical protein